MSVCVLVTGSLFKEGQQRTSQSNRRFVVATIKAAAADNSASHFWNVLAFGDTASSELLRLAIGERLAVQGNLKLETYVKDGETRISRTIFADHVLALRQPPKGKKKQKGGGSDAAAAPLLDNAPQERRRPTPPSSDLDDDIPF